MSAAIPEILAGPIGVTVDLVIGIEAGMDRRVVETVVVRVAGGRAKRRKLVQALTQRPAILTDGRSPAPQLREPCSACARTRPVHSRDREGRPRCDKCPLADDGDPLDLVIGIVAVIDPALPPEVVAAAVRAAVPAPGRRHQLAWTLQERPGLLTGAGAEATIPAVLRLIDTLCDAGANGVVRPPCPHCGRVIALVKPRGGVRPRLRGQVPGRALLRLRAGL